MGYIGILLSLILACIVRISLSQQDAQDNFAFSSGWKMTDRFAGFRFECVGIHDAKSLTHAIRDIADETSAFGMYT